MKLLGGVNSSAASAELHALPDGGNTDGAASGCKPKVRNRTGAVPSAKLKDGKSTSTLAPWLIKYTSASRLTMKGETQTSMNLKATMRKKLSIKLGLAAVVSGALFCGCVQRFNGPELTESGEVYDTCFVPKGHGSDLAIGFDMDGNYHVTPVDITIPARYAIVFKCKHGKFVIDGERAEGLYKQLSRGDSVTIRYCEKFEVRDGHTNAVDLHFIGADKLPD